LLAPVSSRRNLPITPIQSGNVEAQLSTHMTFVTRLRAEISKVFDLEPVRNCQLDSPSDRPLVQAAKRKKYDPYATSPPIGIGLSWHRERQGKYITRMDTVVHGKGPWIFQKSRTVTQRNQSDNETTEVANLQRY